MKIKIKTLDGFFEADAEAGTRLDDLVLSSGILLDRPCGGKGSCGKCRVKVSGEVSGFTECELKHLSPEDRDAGRRLACQARAQGDVEIEIEAGAVFTDKTFSIGADLSEVAGPLGLAFDLGTTTVAAFLVGLESGKVYAGNATLNEQAAFGAEVMSRLSVAEKDPGSLADSIWNSALVAASGLGLSGEVRSRVTRAVAVGNSAMHHLALGLSISSLLRSPFEPETKAPMEAPLHPLSSLFPELTQIYFAPLIGGFVGSDALSCLAYFGLGREGEAALAIDLGTNGEILLAAGNRVLAASTAAGPAFEGVNISCGMRAIPGAVTEVKWDAANGFDLRTIGGEAPRGLSGSGLLSAVRLLRDLDVIETSGRITDSVSAIGVEVRKDDDTKKIILAPGVFISQHDVRELQKAKGAVRAAVEILLERCGVSASDLSRVILTGSFGGRLDPADVLGLGVIPKVKKSRIYSIPNGAGMGAAMMLDDDLFKEAVELAARVEHVELNLDRDFMDRYITSMAFGSE